MTQDPRDRPALAAAAVVWLFVAACPILAGQAAFRATRGGNLLAIVGAAAGAFVLALIFAEPCWRGLRGLLRLLSSGTAQPKRPPRVRAATLVSKVMIEPNVRYSAVMGRWPESAGDALIEEAYSVLASCRSEGRDLFSQDSLQRNLPALNDMLNKLRS